MSEKQTEQDADIWQTGPLYLHSNQNWIAMTKKYRPFFEKGSLIQKHLTREEALTVYKERGGDEAFFSFFYLRYDDAYDTYKWLELASDRSLRDAFNMTRWYAFYKTIGHNDDWCLIAMVYNCPYNYPEFENLDLEFDPKEYIDKEISFENDMECLQQCINKFPDEHELEIHREFVKEYFNKTIPF